jgi:hypothetical protein
MPPADGIARDATAIDAATNDREVENAIQQLPPGVRQFVLATLLSFSIKAQPNTKANRNGTVRAPIFHRPPAFRRLARATEPAALKSLGRRAPRRF